MKAPLSLLLVFFGFSIHAQSILTYYNNCPCKDKSVSTTEDEHTRITLDEKNAYLSIAYDDADYSYEYGGNITLTYFVKKDKQKIFGFAQFMDGPSSAYMEGAFYQIVNNKWEDVSGSVLPDISLEKFTNDSTIIGSIGMDYRVQFILPQHGTEVELRVHPVGENDAPFEYGLYSSMINSIPELILFWNREKGVFEIKP